MSTKKNYMLFWKEHKDNTECMHTYHAKAKTVVPVRRNGATNEVAQGRDT
jgi:hypothetical protein